MVQIPATERLPDAIGGPLLRAAALKGDPTAAYEIGVRYAEGKGVAPNFDEAAKWYDRAAQAGVIPAMFRLGTFYEKGLSVKKDVDVARRYYMQAAERGNAKAMHNLAVLDADGGGKGANYKSASQWFRKAADRGVADSQFNLGILYARGIGVEQNLAESFKWFSLAAAQGDADSARKRDDVAKRLDAQSLAAAKLAIQTFTPEPQPDDAVNVAAPAGGWDAARRTQASTAKPAAKPVLTKRAAPVNLNYSPRRKSTRRPRQKSRPPRGFFSPSGATISVMQGARRFDPHLQGNHAVSGFGRPQGSIPKQTRVQLFLPIADVPVNMFLILAMGRRSASCPACSGSAAAS